MSRPSDPLLGFLRDVVRRKALTSQVLAEKTGIDRSILKRRLAGTEAMTVDDLVLLSDALALGPDELKLTASGPMAPTVVHGGEEVDAPEPADPMGNLPKQVVGLGFALGIDVLLMFDAKQLAGSGVPNSVLDRFKDLLPIRLDARFHRHNKPVFGPDEFQCVLSFDKLYTCAFPWTAFRQVHFMLPVEEPAPPPPPPAPPKVAGKPFLRVIK